MSRYPDGALEFDYRQFTGVNHTPDSPVADPDDFGSFLVGVCKTLGGAHGYICIDIRCDGGSGAGIQQARGR